MGEDPQVFPRITHDCRFRYTEMPGLAQRKTGDPSPKVGLGRRMSSI
jgi:hypothetical protein